jgi:hypothetical protein
MNIHARLRGLVLHCLSTSSGLHSSACFYADKLVTLSNGAPQDVYLLAQVHGVYLGQTVRSTCWVPSELAWPVVTLL